MTDDMGDHELGDGLTCFVISPIGSRLAPVGTEERSKYENAIQMWEYVFEPACQHFGMQPLRADRLAEPGEITEQVFLLLRDADVVVADLTGGNANVMYELGLRHTRDKLTVQMGEYERLPFDVNIIRTIQFRRTEAGLIDARENLMETLRAALQGSATPVTATRLWSELEPIGSDTLAEVAARSEAQEEDDSGEEASAGFIDILAEGEAAITRMTEILQRQAQLMEDLTAITTDTANEISASDTRGGGFAGRLQIARRLAAQLQSLSSEMDELSDEYVRKVDTMGAAVDYIIGTVESDPTTLDDAHEYFEGIVGMADAAEEAAVGLTSVLHGSRDMAKIARDLVPVSKILVRSITRFLSGNETIIGWRARIQALPGWDGDGVSDAASPSS